jgi:DNA-binding transcriptional MerR regulator
MAEAEPDRPTPASGDLTIEQLAQASGLPVSTIRLYQTRRLLPPPTRRGRVGYYDESHLARLRLIGRLQDEGHSLAGIADLLRQWEKGRDLDAVIGVEVTLDSLLGEAHAIEIDPVDLASRFPDGALTADDMQRAAALGIIEPTDTGKLRIIDQRFLETGATLAGLGLPTGVILDEWEQLAEHTDKIAERFITIFEEHLAPDDWRDGLDTERARQLAETLAELQSAARTVLAAALDASVARLGRERLGDLIGR